MDWKPEPELALRPPRQATLADEAVNIAACLILFCVLGADACLIGWGNFSGGLVLFGSCGLLIFSWAFGSRWGMSRRLIKSGSVTCGTVVNSEMTDVSDGEGGTYTQWTWTIAYNTDTVEPQQLVKTSRLDCGWAVGDTLTVLYDPAVPTRAVLYYESRYRAVKR